MAASTVRRYASIRQYLTNHVTQSTRLIPLLVLVRACPSVRSRLRTQFLAIHVWERTSICLLIIVALQTEQYRSAIQ